MKKILFITSADLMKTYYSGGEQRCKMSIDLLHQIYGEENVYKLFFTEFRGELPERYYAFDRLRKWRAGLAQILGNKMYYPWTEIKILKQIEKIDPDIIFFDGSLIGKLLVKLPKKYFTIVSAHNCEKEYYSLKVKHEGLIYIPELIAVYQNEKRAIKNCDSLICINERDSKDMEQCYGRKADIILPILIKDMVDKKRFSEKKYDNTLLFIGSNFGPNYEGIRWFTEKVMCKLPQFKLLIVGKDFEKNASELERKNVEVIGTVDNLEEYYYTCPIMVMPIRYGSGMKVKTAEAMMYGKTILGTDEALEGYNVQNIKGIIRCNTEKEFIDNILLLSEKDVKIFQEEVYQLYRENYSVDAGKNILIKALKREK